jgi:NAD(P)-dependent dehydrogenase (short-subunit alcohol dehydrogenase family)
VPHPGPCTESGSTEYSNRGIGGRSYETGKAAVIAFTRAVAADWAPHRITVNAIAPIHDRPEPWWKSVNPAIIETFKAQVPMGDYGEPEDLAPLAVYLASDASRYMTGAVLVIDGGYTRW